MPTALRWLTQALKGLLTGAVGLLILFEEWGWEPLQRQLARLGKLPLLGAIERRIARLPPYAALALFALPALSLLPVKLLALWFISRGHVLFGTLVILAAKLLGTAILARLYTLTQPALMQLAWFVHWHGRWRVWKEGLLARIRASRIWRRARALKAMARRGWQRLRHAGPGAD
ncbi:MAG TPA: hypothetical protein VLA16_12450 [Ideonella sp.]|nr:hypothetical protein [Ideonella sp.]